ncbi:hypothetical protein MKW92_039046 [Papaver armeniacum]|nr:hypothetical protein MKW92_039046 [Papaver armeniacum]
MKFGWDLKIGLNRYLKSLKNPYGVELTGLPQFVLRYGSVKQFRSGVWNGVQFSGLQNIKPNEIFSSTVVIKTDEVYATYVTKGNDPSIITRTSLNESGEIQRYRWDRQTMKWMLENLIIVAKTIHVKIIGSRIIMFTTIKLQDVIVHTLSYSCIPLAP